MAAQKTTIPIEIQAPPPPLAVSAAIPKSFGELTALDGENTAEAVDFEDATRALTAYIRDNTVGVLPEDAGKKILQAPLKIRVPGSDTELNYNDRVFPNQPDLRYIKFSLPSISMLFLGTSRDEYWAGKAKYKNIDPKTNTVKVRKISATYIRQVQLTGWWRSPIERDRMMGQLIKLFQISQNTGRLTTAKGSHIFMTYLGDRNIDDEDNVEDKIYQSVSTWELRVRGFTDEEYGRVEKIQVTATPTNG